MFGDSRRHVKLTQQYVTWSFLFPSPGESSILSYTLRYVSLPELVTVCQFGLREPMHLCACVSEEGGDGEGVDSEGSSLLSYTLRYVSLSESVTVYQFGL